MIRLTYRGTTTVPIEAECIVPEHLAGKAPAEIAALPVQHGNASVPLGEFFNVDGNADDDEILIEGDCSRIKWIGANMRRGRIAIHGDVGMHLGAEMSGGRIEVHGRASDWAGAEMRGGHIYIHGNAGHLVGGAYRGSRRGMRGGVILVDGKAGNEIGGTMRRGFIAIGGDTGDFTGVSMIAGTIFVFGRPGIRAGAGMKRGTLAFFGESPELLPTFRYDCTYQPTFMRLYLRQLRDWGFPSAAAQADGNYQRYSGDQIALGKGEIFCFRSHPSLARADRAPA